ncbi:MAG TPA: biotin-dependent carboxyltransferase family protein [Pyrinomonadaceae bacterium]|nr:biotin-dependent carboxyltransferase family protein [Pyrinomonadaceae bacterium]
MSILIKKPGILTTIQDLGRVGYRRLGINPGGAMDRTAARLLNILLGNDENEAVVEMHFPAAEIFFEKNAVFAIGGADFSAELDGELIANWRPYFAEKGSTLRFTKKISGNRAYLTVCGGFKIERWLGSSSTNLAAKTGGKDGRPLAAGDHIPLSLQIKAKPRIRNCHISSNLIPYYRPFPTVRVIVGAEFPLLTKSSQGLLYVHDFVVSQNSNRMGFRLKGAPVELAEPFELLSSVASFGTIQLLPDGQLIVLMADHQTSGGYPRVGHVITRDLPLIAQLGPGDKVAFHLIEIDEAEALAAEFELELNFYRIGCKFQANSWQQ